LIPRPGAVPRLLALLVALVSPAAAQTSGATGNAAGLGGPGTADVPALADGSTIAAVDVEVSGEAGGDLAAQARRAFGLASGLRFDPIVAESALGRVRALPGVRDASYRLAVDRATRSLVVVLRVTADAAAPGGPAGILAGRRLAGFPTLWRDERSLVTFIANGGFGGFSEGQPWFGRPLAFTRGSPPVTNPPQGAGTGRRASWGET
jgi:hypothetical protein